MSFLNKVVLVTGAGSGIGREVALRFAKESASLSLVDKNGGTLQETSGKCKAMNVQVLLTVIDLTNDKEVKNLIKNTLKEFGRIDVLVNSAGIVLQNDNIYAENIIETFDKIISVNLRTIVSLTASAVPALIESKGSIVNISSVGSVAGHRMYLAYSTAKAGLNNFSRTLASVLGPKGVRVNCVLPGLVKTNLLINNLGLSETKIEDAINSYKETTLLNKVTNPDEIAEAVFYLASDKAANITGVFLPVDGGVFFKYM